MLQQQQFDIREMPKNPKLFHEHCIEKGRFANLKAASRESLIYDDVHQDEKVRFVCISDTHSKADELMDTLPDGDILIHAGDFTKLSKDPEIEQFNNFLGKMKVRYKYVVVIAGNHELSFDEATWNKSGVWMPLLKVFHSTSPFQRYSNPTESKDLLNNCIYLQDDAIELMGIKIYGSPWQPTFYNMAFNADRGEEIHKIWQCIPDEVDILVTHGPPLGIGDKTQRGQNVGCGNLLVEVQDRIKPRFHVFGHIHEDHGIWSDNQTTFVNAASTDIKHKIRNQPIVFDFLK